MPGSKEKRRKQRTPTPALTVLPALGGAVLFLGTYLLTAEAVGSPFLHWLVAVAAGAAGWAAGFVLERARRED